MPGLRTLCASLMAFALEALLAAQTRAQTPFAYEIRFNHNPKIDLFRVAVLPTNVLLRGRSLGGDSACRSQGLVLSKDGSDREPMRFTNSVGEKYTTRGKYAATSSGHQIDVAHSAVTPDGKPFTEHYT